MTRVIRLALVWALVCCTLVPARAATEIAALSDGRRLVIVQPDGAPPKGIVLLIPGGATTLSLGPNGETRSTNFVIRTRDQLLAAGFAIAYMDDPANLAPALDRLRQIAKPVVILSTSRGTIVAVKNAARLGPQGPDLLILTSPVTVGADSLATVDVHSITIPTLITSNVGDTCRASPSAGASALALRFTSRVSFLTFSSTAATSPPCEPLSPHGYFGIESTVMTKIIDWIGDR